MSADEQLIYDTAVAGCARMARTGETIPSAHMPIVAAVLIAISNNNIAAAIRETIQDELTPMETGETTEQENGLL